MDKLNIPKVIKVGYQERSNTYTGKLAYIIYIDEKGKIRKETSWNNWRSKKIDPEDFDNEPTEGFVLNKSGGGTRESYGWNPRNEFIRVYDPRGFEFEISLANLLFILQECTSTKGKGIEGEFVYGWDGTNLVLIPTCCKEYKESLKFTALKSKKIVRKDMVEGYTYQTKSMEKLVYLGRHAIRNLGYRYNRCVTQYEELNTLPYVRKDIFYDITNNRFSYLPGLNTIAEEVDSTINPKYAEWFTEFTDSSEVSELAEMVLVSLDREQISMASSGIFLIKVEDNLYIPVRLYNWHNLGRNITYSKIPYSKIKDISSLHESYKFAIRSDLLNTLYKDNELYTVVYRLKSGKQIKADYYEHQ